MNRIDKNTTSRMRRLTMLITALYVIIVLIACDFASNQSVTIHRNNNSQFEIIGPEGQRALIDVISPLNLSRPPDDKDILLTTHFHPDHYSREFLDQFPGQQLQVREGEIKRSALTIKGIASLHSHDPHDTFKPSGGSNYIFVVEIAGLRIAHFGDIGQKKLTDAQLAAMGKVDVAITQFVNPYSDMDLVNKKGYGLMEQVRPSFIIPHHGADRVDAIRLAKEKWDVYYADSSLIVSKQNLPEKITVLIIGERDFIYKKLNLKKWS